MEDLSKIVKSINFGKRKNTRGQVSYYISTVLNVGTTTPSYEHPVKKEDIALINTIKVLYGGDVEPIKSKKLVEMDSEGGNKYYSVNVELIDGSMLMYYNFPFNFKKTIDLVRNYINSQSQNNVKEKNLK